MSSKVTGDAQSDAGPGGDKNQALPTEMVDNSAAEAGALTVAENPEPAAESGTARSESGPEAAEFVPEQPTGTMDAAGPARAPHRLSRPRAKTRTTTKTKTASTETNCPTRRNRPS